MITHIKVTGTYEKDRFRRNRLITLYGLESGILMKKEREINVIDNVAGELIQRIKDGVIFHRR